MIILRAKELKRSGSSFCKEAFCYYIVFDGRTDGLRRRQLFLSCHGFEAANRKISVWRIAAAAHLFSAALSFRFLGTLWSAAIFIIAAF